MKIIKKNDLYKSITLVPRILPNDGDTLFVQMRNETNDETVEIPHTWYYSNNFFTLELGIPTVGVDFYKEYNDYEIKIFRNGYLIYMGKVRVIGVDDSIQDFQITTPINNKIKF